MRRFSTAEYLAVFVSAGALIVSLYSPFRDYFASPDLRVILPTHMQLATNLGVSQVTPMITIINDGAAPGHFAELECVLSTDSETLELRATTITVPTGGPIGSNQPFAGVSLASSEEYLNHVNCSPANLDQSASRQYDRILADARSEVQRAGGLNCENNWFSRRFRFSEDLTTRLLDFMDDNFSFKEGEYSLAVMIVDADGSVIASTEKSFELAQDDIERLLEPRDLLAFGFGTICPLLGPGSIQVPLVR